jgi:hypothetical protein
VALAPRGVHSRNWVCEFCGYLGSCAALSGSYRRFETTCWSHITKVKQLNCCITVKMVSIACPETSVTGYLSALRHIREERIAFTPRQKPDIRVLGTSDSLDWKCVCVYVLYIV